MKKLIYAALAAVALVAGGACSDNGRGWSVAGVVNGADNQKLALEGYNNGNWYVVDSIDLAGDGSFKYVADAPAAYPDIMRVTLGGRSIYFPIDSIDQIAISTTADGFGTDYSLEGSLHAVTMRRVDSVLNASVEAIGVAATISDKALKTNLFSVAYEDSSILSLYYLVNKTVGGKQLFNLTDRGDLRLYGAVAQRFIMERPDDPRTAFIEATYRNGRKATSNNVAEIDVAETGLFDIVRYDAKGQKQSLAELTDGGKVVILSFTSYQLESSTAYNVILNGLWEQYHNAGLEIYQVSFDGDESLWKLRAANLPWVAVWNSTTDGVDVMAQYNVQSLPTTYIIDRGGNIAARVLDPTDLESEVKKYMAVR